MKRERQQYFKSLGYKIVTEEDWDKYYIYSLRSREDKYKEHYLPYNDKIEVYLKITKGDDDYEYYNLISYDEGVFKIYLESCLPTAYGTKIDIYDTERYYELESLEEIQNLLYK